MALEAWEATRSALDIEWQAIGVPGTWWTGAERRAIAAEGRAARECVLCAERKTALSPNAVAGGHPANPALSAAAVDAVHRIATDPGRLSSSWYRSCLSGGLLPEQVVEMTGVLGVLTLADSLARALDCEPPPLPDALPGAPSRTRPAGVEVKGGWAPMVTPAGAEGEVRIMYDLVDSAAGFVFNVVRALSAVPASMGAFFRTFLPNYATHGAVPEGALSRPQVELLASSTSALNDCFY